MKLLQIFRRRSKRRIWYHWRSTWRTSY